MKQSSSWVAVVVVVVLATVLADRVFLKQHRQLKAAATPKTTTLGDAPNVTFKDLQGKDVPLSSFKGKVVLLNFWATWCEPCRVEIPYLIKSQEQYGPRGFTVVGAAMDEEGQRVVAPFVVKPQWDVDGKQVAMNYPIVLSDNELADKFGGILGLPTSVLISKDGKVLKRYLGMVNPDSLSKDVEAQLK